MPMAAPRQLLKRRPMIVSPFGPHSHQGKPYLACRGFYSLPQHSHHRYFASSTATAKPTPKSSAIDEHDRRVAEAQARILARIHNQNIQTKENKQQELQRIAAEDMHSIMQTIHHWLLKDINFFVRTMEALDISLSEGDKSIAVTSSTGAVKVESGSSRRRRSSENVAAADETSSLQFLNGHHPLQVVLDQYRQLYYDSIPEFEEMMQQNDNAFLLQHKIVQRLKETGFADPQWSRRFRQVKGYQIQQDGLMRNVAKQTVDLQRHQAALAKAQRELKEFEKMERVVAASVDPAKTSSRRERKMKSKPTSKVTTSPKTDESTAKQLPSLFQKAWTAVSSLWGAPATPPSVTEKVQESKSETYQNATPVRGPKSPHRPKAIDGLKGMIFRKQAGIRRLEEHVNDASDRLERTQRQIDEMEVPLTEMEYKRAQTTVFEVRDVLCREFAKQMQDKHAHLIAQYEVLNAKTDLTKPQEWFPYARLDRRKIIFHGGPTNSGKTYSALQRLKEAKQGIYLGPLRLLAAEIYETLTAEGIYTNLFTGQEKREIAFSTHTSATVEMFNAAKEYDVAVIDEIQMVADPTRGAAWTRALLGLRCKEVHVCGGMEARNIVEQLAKACGDDFELHTYKRFTELQVSNRSLARNFKKTGAYRNVQPGDCVVAFSRNDIFAIKREIENNTDYKCCVIYGKLPPQTRADQARRFNDLDSGYDILVASDAIGMGLNLNIKRIVFNSIFKYNGDKIIRLSHSEVKQISGRAGRRNSPYPLGEVTCRDPRDLPFIRECLATDIELVEKAGLLPTAGHIEMFSEAMSAYEVEDKDSMLDLDQVLKQFNAMATVKGDFFLGRQHELQMIAKRIKNIPLSLRDSYNMCLSPSNELSLDLLESFAWKYSRGEVPGLPSRSVPKRAKSFDDLSHLCGIYADSDLFLWLGFKFPPCNAVEQAAAMNRKENTLEFINEALAASESLKLTHCYLRQATRQRNSWEAENGKSNEIGLYDDTDDDEDEDDEEDDYLSEENREAIF